MGGNVKGITLIRNIEPEFYDDLRVEWGKRAWGKGGKRNVCLYSKCRRQGLKVKNKETYIR